MDDHWAICECYGLKAAQENAHAVTASALPRLRELFDELGIAATFFVVGRDLEDPPTASLFQRLKTAGHRFANHSYSHALNFRALDRQTMQQEIERAEHLITETLERPLGFRAPGYGSSGLLHEVLESRGYAYDSSVMAGPYGFVFRWLDARLQRQAGGTSARSKTQYSYLRDARTPLSMHRIAGGNLWELPVAASPLLRLPFQAGVCMRLGLKYFEANLRVWRRRPDVPLLFLIHAADVADFSHAKEKLFQTVPYFAQPVETKVALLRRYVQRIAEERPVMTTEDWLGKAVES